MARRQEHLFMLDIHMVAMHMQRMFSTRDRLETWKMCIGESHENVLAAADSTQMLWTVGCMSTKWHGEIDHADTGSWKQERAKVMHNS